MSDAHPCLNCGACCSAFRVAMYWSEVDDRGIDPALTRKLDPLRVEMRVDNTADLRCVALAGVIGVATSCTIYSARPSPCRDLQAAWEDGTPSPQCDRARARHGLPPLTPEDWSAPESGCSPGFSRRGPELAQDRDPAPVVSHVPLSPNAL